MRPQRDPRPSIPRFSGSMPLGRSCEHRINILDIGPLGRRASPDYRARDEPSRTSTSPWSAPLAQMGAGNTVPARTLGPAQYEPFQKHFGPAASGVESLCSP
ncbi:hypothetical protein CMUS01_04032 [Colletotrichum musicola]|uniref:Uncharacterized protein n=1 Tax=Colletotrichum musicola TaxID=2175873 RepID=A0A8H6NPJ0_9PEZI|nr:hypothetical protein CMUS01_04032 [Colletotrichum musicola]